jgi:biotin transporter BioY
MGIEFIYRTIKTTLILAALIFVVATIYYDFKIGLGILVGAGWGCLNLYFLTNLIQGALDPEKPNKRKIALIALVKFPLLYLLGYFFLRLKYFSVVSLLSGFTLIFVVIFLKALGRWVLAISQPKESSLSSMEKKPKG